MVAKYGSCIRKSPCRLRDSERHVRGASCSIILSGQPMDEVLTIAQIESKFDSEWVLIEDPQTDEALEVHSGTVRWHGKDREEVYRRAVEIRPKRFAIVYTGKMPQGTAIVL